MSESTPPRSEDSGDTAAATGFAATPGDHGFAQGKSLGRYVVLGRLGGGGMGVVYSAYDQKLDRRVALKLLRPDATSSVEAHERLVREAQALARLAHPNVVSIHDVGEFEGTVFLDMEFMAGGTLTTWLQTKHEWREVLRVFVAAGRGLAAAHAVGIIHRDFKPDNVLLGADGQVKVADFGIARSSIDTTKLSDAEAAAIGAELRESPSLTRTGAVHGTPAYMSPEQWRGAAIDARSDQYSFCVALYEALVGERPDASPVRVKLPASGGAGLSVKVYRILSRGMNLDPAARYSSMGELLTALEGAAQPWHRSGWLAVIAGAVALAAVTYATFGGAHEMNRACRDARAKLGNVWDDEARSAVKGSFAASDASYASDVWRSVEHALDAYTTSWAAMQEEACEATRVRKEQTEDVLALRTACLDRRRDELGALVGTLRNADRSVVAHAVDAVGALAPLDRCSDWKALALRVAPPPDAAREAVGAVRRDLALGKALFDEGKVREGLAPATHADDAAQKLGYRPLRAESSLLLGRLQGGTGDFKTAEGTLRDAVLHAEAGGDELTAAQSWAALVRVDAKNEQFERGVSDAAHARALLDHTGDDETRAAVAENVGALLYEQGKFAESEASYAEALAIEERRLGPESPRVAVLLGNLTDEKVEESHYDGALEAYTRSLAILERAYGPHHAEVARTLNAMGVVLANQGKYAEAAPYFRRAVTANEEALGPDHPNLARALITLAGILRDIDATHADESRALLQRALTIQQKALGPEHTDVSRTLAELANVAEDAGDYDAARSYLVHALAIGEKALGPDHRRVEDLLDDLARLDLLHGSPEEALAYGKRALVIVQKALGPNHPYVADSLTIQGRALLALHRPAEAIPLLERALPLRMTGDTPADDAAETQFALARALADSHGDHARARDLATRAQQGLAGGSARDLRARAEVDAWLRVTPP